MSKILFGRYSPCAVDCSDGQVTLKHFTDVTDEDIQLLEVIHTNQSLPKNISTKQLDKLIYLDKKYDLPLVAALINPCYATIKAVFELLKHIPKRFLSCCIIKEMLADNNVEMFKWKVDQGFVPDKLEIDQITREGNIPMLEILAGSRESCLVTYHSWVYQIADRSTFEWASNKFGCEVEKDRIAKMAIWIHGDGALETLEWCNIGTLHRSFHSALWEAAARYASPVMLDFLDQHLQPYSNADYLIYEMKAENVLWFLTKNRVQPHNVIRDIVSKGDVDLIRRVDEVHPFIDDPETCRRLMQDAIICGFLNVLKYLEERTNYQFREGDFATAVQCVRLDIVNYLLEKGISPDLITIKDIIISGSVDIANMFFKPDMVIPTDTIKTLLEYRKSECHLLAQYFIDKGYKPTTNCLELSVIYHNHDMIKVIVDAGVPVTKKHLQLLIGNLCFKSASVIAKKLAEGKNKSPDALARDIATGDIDKVKKRLSQGVEPTKHHIELASQLGYYEILALLCGFCKK